MLNLRGIKYLALAGCVIFTSGTAIANGKKSVTKKKSVKKTDKVVKKTDKAVKKTDAVVKKRTLSFEDRFKRVRGDYNANRLRGAAAWAQFYDIEKKASALNKSQRASLHQIQADILMRAGYPVLASIYAAEAIKTHPEPMHNDLSKAWSTLKLITRQKPLQMLTEQMAREINTNEKVPHFGRDWYYFEGNSADSKGDKKKALEYYSKLRMDDRYFLPAKYQKAMILAEEKQTKKAISELKAILTALAEVKPNLNQMEKQRVWDMTNLALGRLLYEEEDFNKAIVHFRNVTRGGDYFYDSLFEQSWAFFMAGYPSHALGTLHGAESPFYQEVFNPEASMLKSIVLYWMCRYEDSRNALADFMENHSKTVESLGVFLDRQRLSAQTAYQLFEDLVSGVSADSLGIPKDILKSAAESEHMMLLRDQYAHAYYELDRLDGVGINNYKNDMSFAKNRLKSYISQIKNDIGETYIVELKAMKQTFDRLYDQAQFLYIELLMSEKEQILGRELHGDSKLTASNSDRRVRGWANKTVAWEVDEKNEFWWDEIGYHIYDIDPQCSNK